MRFIATGFLNFFLVRALGLFHLPAMPRLKSRQSQIPNGFIFFQPETQWKPPPFASFQTIVDSLISHRKGNPYLVQKHGWSTDPVAVANEVDEFNAKVCQHMGWNDYVDAGAGGAPTVPFPLLNPPSLSGRLNQLVAGGKTLVKWVTRKEEAVPANLAEDRARICCNPNADGKPCPLNTKGDWTAFFTVPVSNAIRAAVEDRARMNLTTPYDDQLGVCDGCNCPLKLKVHMGIDSILADMPQESFDALVPGCWIRAEKR